MLRPLARSPSLSEAVYRELRDRIVSGDLEVGAPLPAERILCEALGVNRGAVREGLRRLEHARLVSVRHGGTSRVLDYRDSAGLDLLPEMLLTPDGVLDTQVVRSVVEMRSALGRDVARRAAERRTAEAVARLRQVLRSMAELSAELRALQDLASDFWSTLVDAAQNIAYRLAYNSLRQSYDRSRDLFTELLAEEVGDVGAHSALVDAVEAGDARLAEQLAADLLARGERAITALLDRVGES